MRGVEECVVRMRRGAMRCFLRRNSPKWPRYRISGIAGYISGSGALLTVIAVLEPWSKGNEFSPSNVSWTAVAVLCADERAGGENASHPVLLVVVCYAEAWLSCGSAILSG